MTVRVVITRAKLTPITVQKAAKTTAIKKAAVPVDEPLMAPTS